MNTNFLGLISAVILLSGCKEMDSEYRDFIVPNGYTYPQRADSLKVFPGYNKLRLEWMKPKSPTLRYAMVHWNNNEDSLKVEWNTDDAILFAEIPGLSETAHTFYVRHVDHRGNVSLPAEITGTPYGDNYLISATDRSYAAALRSPDGTGTITWGPKTPDLLYTEVRYTAADGSQKTVRTDAGQAQASCPGIKPGEPFEYRSVFLPNNGIEPVSRPWQTSEKPFLYKYPRTNWTVQARNGNHPWGDGGGGEPELLLDGNMSTGWHSRVGTPLPQVVVVDMQESLDIDNIVFYPPGQANWRYMNRVDAYLSDDPLPADEPSAAWGTPAASVTYPGGDSFAIMLEPAKKGRYLALVFLDSKASTYISFMELEAYGY